MVPKENVTKALPNVEMTTVAQVHRGSGLSLGRLIMASKMMPQDNIEMA